MTFLNGARRIWGLYTRLFRVVPINCEIKSARDTFITRDGWSANGVDPQLEVLAKESRMPPGWYRLSYDAHHPSGDMLFVPKIYPLNALETVATFPTYFPKGYGSSNAVTRFLKDKQKQARQEEDSSTHSKGRQAEDGIANPNGNEAPSDPARSTKTPTTDSCPADDTVAANNSDVSTPAVPVINLRPHLPGQIQHLFRYGFEPKGFRFDPFELDYPKTLEPYHGSFQLNDFRLTFYGVIPFLIFSFRQTVLGADHKWRFRRIRNALQLLNKKGKTALVNWLAHKAYLKIQPPFSPTSWYRFFCDPHCFDTNRTDWFEDLSVQPSFSLFLFLGESSPKLLSDTVSSVLCQSYSKVELSIVTTSTSQPEIIQQANLLAKKHTDIRVMRCEYEDFRQALDKDKSDFICLIESGDRLRPHAVVRLASALSSDGTDLAYADEVILTTSGRRIHKVVLRPAFCLDHFLNHPCIGLMTAIRRELLTTGEALSDCTSVEILNERLILDALISAQKIVHIPDLILERLSPSTVPSARRLPVSSISKFLKDHAFMDATVRPTTNPGLYSIRYNNPLPGKTAIIIPTKNHHEILEIAVDSLTRTVPKELYDLVVVNHESDDPNTVAYLHEIAKAHRVINYQGVFNFSKINNFAVTQLDETYGSFLFMNNDIQATKEGWLESMRDKLGQRHVGVVGAILLYPPNSGEKDVGTTKEAESLGSSSIQSQDFQKISSAIANADLSRCRIQHAGVHLGVGVAEHYLKYEQYQDAYLQRPSLNPAVPNPVTRSFSAVTAACLLIRKEVFSELEGFDEELAVGFQDVDLCLRAGNEGYKVLCDAEAVLFHHESASRNTNDFLERDPHPQDTANFRHRYVHDIGRDPFYHPMLSTTTPQFRPLRSMNRPRADVRVVANLGLKPFEP